MNFSDLVKAAKPPKGYSPIPGGKKGGYRKRVGGKWSYWYAEDTKGRKKGKTIVVASAGGSDRYRLDKVELPEPDEATATANAEFRDAIIDSIMYASDNMADPKILPSSRSTWDSRRAEYQPNAPDAVAFAFRSAASTHHTTYYVNREGSQFKVWFQPSPRQDPATGAWVDTPPGYVTEGTTDPDEVARSFFELGPDPEEDRRMNFTDPEEDRRMNFTDLVKAAGGAYTGPGKRTGTPGNYSYTYDGDKSGGGKGKAEKPEAKERAKVMVSVGTLPKGVRERLEKYNLSVVAAAGSPPEKALEIARRLEAGIEKQADICQSNPPICAGNMGIPRADMPQIMDDTIPELLASKDAGERAKGEAAVAAGADPKGEKAPFDMMIDHFRSEGIEVTKPATVKVSDLKATQEDIRDNKATFFAETQMKGTWPNGKPADLSAQPIVVSNDGHILDGHHRWAALLMLGEEATMQAIKVDLPMAELLDKSFDVPGAGVFRMDGDNNVQEGGKPDYAEYKRKADEKYDGALAAAATAEPVKKALDLVKGAPKGYSPIPGSSKGGYRKQVGGKWQYWYPDGRASESGHSEGLPKELEAAKELKDKLARVMSALSQKQHEASHGMRFVPAFAEYRSPEQQKKYDASKKATDAITVKYEAARDKFNEAAHHFSALKRAQTKKSLPGFTDLVKGCSAGLEKSDDEELEKSEDGHKGQTCAAAHPGQDHEKWSASKLAKGDDEEEDEEDPAEKEAREAELGKGLFNSIWNAYEGGNSLGR